MSTVSRIKYQGTALPGNAERVVLFNSENLGVSPIHFDVQRFTYDIDHSHSATVEGYKRNADSSAWVRFYTQAITASATATSRADVFVGGLKAFKFEVLNGATPQTKFDVDCTIARDRSAAV